MWEIKMAHIAITDQEEFIIRIAVEYKKRL